MFNEPGSLDGSWVGSVFVLSIVFGMMAAENRLLRTPKQSPAQFSSHGLKSIATSIRRNGLIVGIVCAAAFGSLIYAVVGTSASGPEIVVGETIHTIQLDVFNGTNESKLAQRMTDFLRERGFDVVEIGNYDGELEESLVIDRVGNVQAAKQVARSLGITEEHVIQQVDKTLYLDVSVYIGNDFKSLHPFK